MNNSLETLSRAPSRELFQRQCILKKLANIFSIKISCCRKQYIQMSHKEGNGDPVSKALFE